MYKEMGGQNEANLTYDQVATAMTDEVSKRKISNCNREYNGNKLSHRWVQLEAGIPDPPGWEQPHVGFETAKAKGSKAGIVAAASEADTAMGDPEEKWTWDASENNYFRFDSTTLEIVWKEAGRATALEVDTTMSDIPVDDLEGDWIWDADENNYFRVDSNTLEIVWYEAPSSILV
jgi:hypothetical protein